MRILYKYSVNVAAKIWESSGEAMSGHIFAIDDDEIDLMAMKRGISRSELSITLTTEQNPVRALEILGEMADDPNETLPTAVLLDLNMPQMDGFEFLERVRNHAKLSRIVVFVCSTSADPRDVARAYSYGIAGYLVKNELGVRYEKLISLLDSYVASVTPCPTLH